MGGVAGLRTSATMLAQTSLCSVSCHGLTINLFDSNLAFRFLETLSSPCNVPVPIKLAELLDAPPRSDHEMRLAETVNPNGEIQPESASDESPVVSLDGTESLANSRVAELKKEDNEEEPDILSETPARN